MRLCKSSEDLLFCFLYVNKEKMLFGVNLDGGCSLVGLSVVEMWGVGGKKFIKQCVICITHCDIYKTHCIIYITQCVMKNFVGPEGFSTGVLT